MELAAPTPEIVRKKGVCGGDPTIAGTRIAVHDVVRHVRAYDGDLERVSTEALPHLSVSQIRAVLDWYAAHREEIDEILRQEAAAFERLRSQSRDPNTR
jgi:uncharacterized protein (DUF433 family)